MSPSRPRTRPDLRTRRNTTPTLVRQSLFQPVQIQFCLHVLTILRLRDLLRRRGRPSFPRRDHYRPPPRPARHHPTLHPHSRQQRCLNHHILHRQHSLLRRKGALRPLHIGIDAWCAVGPRVCGGAAGRGYGEGDARERVGF